MLEMTPRAPRVRIDVLFAADDRRVALLDEVFWSLRETPKQIAPRWLYDERGSELFDEITRLPEYYPTRTEWMILEGCAAEVAELTGATTLVELGSGTSEKTTLLLDALHAVGTLAVFAPVDVSEEILSQSANAIAARYEGIGVEAVVGDFEKHLHSIPKGSPRLLAFLGSTIGNLGPEHRARFLRAVSETLAADDHFLLGIDLVKSPERLEAAYNDSAGITEAFVRNALTVLDRELGSRFDQEGFSFEARWDAENEWVELGLRSLRAQTVALPVLDTDVSFGDGELLRIEVSSKFRREGIEKELAAAGLTVERWWTDPDGDFGLLLATPAVSASETP
ncbi:MAG: L-histidine N(alpha)-methyltransferase [Thermoleophilia bacterium]|nr:L-histidine N(alpha)-methyltransferase [Thermoleophilia bacterium]